MTARQATTMSYPVTVVGSGYMGKGIAHTLARGGARVTLVDQDPVLTERAYHAMVADVEKAESDGLLDAGSADRVRENTTWAPLLADGVRGARLVVEAVYEDIDVKRAVLERIEAVARPDAVIATNTSAIPVGDLATALTRPQRFFGIHWFNPAPYLPGVEVIVARESDESLLTPVLELLVRAGKEPVTVADLPGFVANRLQFALFKEATLMVEEGVATPDEIDGVVKSTFGFRLPFFGPFAVADMAGLDVYAAGMSTLAKTVGERFAVPEALAQKVAAGELGTKSGSGFLSLTPEEAAAMIERRDRLYVALSRLRDDEATERSHT
jgi:3-hydroxybutyryl-CoA dehydrogenase